MTKSTHNSLPRDNSTVLKILNSPELPFQETKYYLKKLDEYCTELSMAKEDTNNLELYFNIGITCFILGKYLLAKDYLEKAIEYNPRLVYYILGLSYYNKAKLIEKSGNFNASRHNYEKAVINFEDALEASSDIPSSSQIYYDLGVVFYELEDYNELSKVIDDMIKVDPRILFDRLYKNYRQKTIKHII